MRMFPMFTLALLALAVPDGASAGQLFNESFNGGFDSTWLASSGVFPPSSSGLTYTYLGAPNGTFVTVDGAQTIRMTNTLTQFQEVGFVTDQTFAASDLELQARINTLVQDSQRIDGFFRLWLINADDPTRYVNFGLFGSNFSSNRLFTWSSSIDAPGDASFNYVSNTWYRPTLIADGNTLRVGIFDDSGNTELVGHSFSHSLAALGTNFRIGVDQFLGLPTSPFVVDVAVDSVTLSTTAVPEPSSLALAGTGLLTVLGCGWRKRKNERTESPPELS